jgi:cytochrome c peroxidase
MLADTSPCRTKALAFTLGFMLTLPMHAAFAEPGGQSMSPSTPMELPLEVEIEVSPAGSLKGVPLWRELYELLENPGAFTCTDPADPTTCIATVERRPSFRDEELPPLKIWPPSYNFLTHEPMRLRNLPGEEEVSLDQPGPLFDPDEVVPVDEFNVPTELRSVIGELVACPTAPIAGDPTLIVRRAQWHQRFTCSGKEDGTLVVSNPGGSARMLLGYTGFVADTSIPPHGTVVANPADEELDEIYAGLEELEIPINEEDFFREEDDIDDVNPVLQEYIGRAGAEVLGKALFWDMQVGSDGVQACGSCHFHAGVDSRTRNQLNPNTMGGDTTLQVRGPNEDVQATDFPFHKRAPDVPGDGTLVATSDANDVMSSMGVSRFEQFVDIPPIGEFLPGANGVAALPPDIGTPLTDMAVMQDLRRVEPRNTPTFHGAAFNLDNFWDGRARFVFNGGSVFGASDPQTHVFWQDDVDGLVGATNGHVRAEEEAGGAEEEEEEEGGADQPVRIKFSSLASQALGPPLSEFEMSFLGRNWQKIGKKLLQAGVTPLANQRVATDDSALGPLSNQGGASCIALGRATAIGKPGLCVSYPELIELAFREELWENTDSHLAGAFDPDDPFDRYSVSIVTAVAADPMNRDQYTQMEANFSLFFGLGVQAYVTLTIPDDSYLDRFFDLNPNAGNAIGEPGDQAVLFPTLVPGFVADDEPCPAPNVQNGVLCLPPGFGPDELFGFDLFAGGNLTAALEPGTARNPLHTITTEGGEELDIAVGSNPFTRSAKCMLCHLGPEQTDHSINISHGLLHGGAEFEYPTPPFLPDPGILEGKPTVFLDGQVPAPEPSGSSLIVTGLILSEEVSEGAAQDAVEVEPRDFAVFDDPVTPWDDRVVAQHSSFAFGDQGVYNIGLRPAAEDLGRGGDDPFGWPLSLSALTLINIAGDGSGNPATPANRFQPCDDAVGPPGGCRMANVDPFELGYTFELTGGGAFFPGTTYTLQSINPGFERGPIQPLLPEYMVPWMHDLSAGEAHPTIDEMAGMVPNTVTPPIAGPAIEFFEVMFGADLHCALYDPAQFGSGSPNFGWGPTIEGVSACPNNGSGVTGNLHFPSHGTWPVPNRVLRNGAFKAPPLRNVEMTGPYFHTGSYLTLRQVVDFYFRGGDFPITNAANRDPHVVDLFHQAFAFGRTTGEDLNSETNFGFLIGTFADGLPDPVFQYDEYPDSDHGISPELGDPANPGSREAAIEDAKDALVKFLIALTDPRVKYERAPFDRPEIFVPIDGGAPANTGGRDELVSLSGVQCADLTHPNPGPVCFRQLPPVGEYGSATPTPNFLGISSTPVPGDANDHFDPF